MPKIKKVLSKQGLEELKELLDKEWPPIIARSKIDEYTGGTYQSGTLANEDSKGTGPKNPVYGQGGRVSYLKPYLIDWVMNKVIVKETIDLNN